MFKIFERIKQAGVQLGRPFKKADKPVQSLPEQRVLPAMRAFYEQLKSAGFKPAPLSPEQKLTMLDDCVNIILRKDLQLSDGSGGRVYSLPLSMQQDKGRQFYLVIAVSGAKRLREIVVALTDNRSYLTAQWATLEDCVQEAPAAAFFRTLVPAFDAKKVLKVASVPVRPDTLRSTPVSNSLPAAATGD